MVCKTIYVMERRCRNVAESQNLKMEMSLRCVIVNAINEASNITTLIRTNDKAF